MLIAAGNGQVDVMDALLAKGANINDDFTVEDKTTGQSLKGITLLMWAASNDHLDAVKFLIEKGVDLKEKRTERQSNWKTMCVTNVEGKNAMYFAIESGNIEIEAVAARKPVMAGEKHSLLNKGKTNRTLVH